MIPFTSLVMGWLSHLFTSSIFDAAVMWLFSNHVSVEEEKKNDPEISLSESEGDDTVNQGDSGDRNGDDDDIDMNKTSETSSLLVDFEKGVPQTKKRIRKRISFVPALLLMITGHWVGGFLGGWISATITHTHMNIPQSTVLNYVLILGIMVTVYFIIQSLDHRNSRFTPSWYKAVVIVTLPVMVFNGGRTVCTEGDPWSHWY